MTLKTPELMYHRPLDKESSDNKLDTSKLALYIFPACLKKKKKRQREEGKITGTSRQSGVFTRSPRSTIRYSLCLDDNTSLLLAQKLSLKQPA